jgi:hypothetical protein
LWGDEDYILHKGHAHGMVAVDIRGDKVTQSQWTQGTEFLLSASRIRGAHRTVNEYHSSLRDSGSNVGPAVSRLRLHPEGLDRMV